MQQVPHQKLLKCLTRSPLRGYSSARCTAGRLHHLNGSAWSVPGAAWWPSVVLTIDGAMDSMDATSRSVAEAHVRSHCPSVLCMGKAGCLATTSSGSPSA